MSALPQHDERVTCLSCRFSYPGVRGFCPMCGTPAPAPEDVVLGPRPVADKPARKPTDELPASGKPWIWMRRPLGVGAALLLVAGGIFFLRARNAPAPDIIAPASAIAAPAGDPAPVSPAVPEKVAVEPPPESPERIVPTPRAATSLSASDDPADLWKRVAKGNTDAEVTLAKLYLDGNQVTRNCEQAHLLLLSAAKKRSRSAEQVLSSLYPQHCP